MKITSIQVMRVYPTNDTYWKPIVCRVYTDAGLYGDGEAAMCYGTGATAAYGMLKDLSELVIGMDPLENEVIWDKLYKLTFWGQNGGPVFFAALAAIDIALWDIKGKYFGVPVYKLLGGKLRDNLRTYASQLHYSWTGTRLNAVKTEDYAKFARQGVDDGYDAIKIDFLEYDKDGTFLSDVEDKKRLLNPYFVDLFEERVAAVREAIGPDVDLIIENHATTDANTAVQLGRRVAKYNIFLYEEPGTPTPKTMKYVADHVPIPLANGERIYTRWQYMPYFENGSLRVIQPDIGNCGGLTEVKKICDAAYLYDVGVQAHVCGSPLSTAVALHLECAIPNFVIHEHHYRNLLPMNKELCIHDYQPVKGRFKVPELPGIGNELSEFAMTHCDKTIVK